MDQPDKKHDEKEEMEEEMPSDNGEDIEYCDDDEIDLMDQDDEEDDDFKTMKESEIGDGDMY